MANYTLTITPANGSIVSEVSDIYVTCEEGIEWNVNDALYFHVFDADGNVAAGVWQAPYVSETTYRLPLEDDDDPGDVFITLTEKGEYHFTIPAGTFYLGSDRELSEEINVTFTIGEPPFSLPLTDLDGLVTGSAYVVPTEGSGDGVVSVTADEGNEGLDRSGVVTFSTTGGEVSVARTIVQLGLREPFAASDGDFEVADGGTFHVLK